MTPESVFGVLHLADRFALMLRTLAGKPVPKLPHAPGRRCRPLGEIPEHDPHAEAWDALERPAVSDHQPAPVDAATGVHACAVGLLPLGARCVLTEALPLNHSAPHGET